MFKGLMKVVQIIMMAMLVAGVGMCVLAYRNVGWEEVTKRIVFIIGLFLTLLSITWFVLIFMLNYLYSPNFSKATIPRKKRKKRR